MGTEFFLGFVLCFLLLVFNLLTLFICNIQRNFIFHHNSLCNSISTFHARLCTCVGCTTGERLDILLRVFFSVVPTFEMIIGLNDCIFYHFIDENLRKELL